MAQNPDNIRWIPPLPAGWEAKYDPTQKRYFFIDHTTKKTTWDDPRFTRSVAPQRQAQPQQQQYGYGQYYNPQQHHHQQQQQYYQQQQQQQHYQQQQYHHPQQQQAEAIPMKTLANQYIAAQGQGFNDQATRSWQPHPTAAAAATRQPSPRRQPQPQPQQEEESSFVEDLPAFEVDENLVRQLQATFPTCPVDKIRRTLERNCNAERASELELEVFGYKKAASPRRSLSPTNQSAQARQSSGLPGTNHIVQKLKKEFQRAEVGFIQDILAEVNNSEHKAREQLKSMGYGSSSAAGSSSTVVKTAPASRGSTGSAQSPRRAASPPPKPTVTGAMKAVLVQELAKDHPNLDKTIVELALETADYNVEKARDMLTFMYTDNTTTSPKKTSPPRQTTSPTRQTTSPTRQTPAGAAAATSSSIPDISISAGTSDAGYDEISQDYYLYDNYAKPASVTSVGRDRARSPSPSPSKTKRDNQRQHAKAQDRRPKHTSDYLYQTASYNVLGLLENCCPRPLASSYTSVQSDPPDDSVSKISVGPKEVVTSQKQVMTSRNKTVAKGPDPSLCQGADLSRVERYGVVTNGPNRKLRQGPDPSRVKGSQGAKGHDPGLCRGPQPEHHQGHQPNLCRGPATIITASRTLISQV